MGQVAKAGVVGLIAMTVGLYAVVSNAYGGDKQAMLDGFHVLAERLGPSAMPVFILVHTVAIALCFPYAIFFEAAASFLFGFVNGVICVFSAKVMGAALAFWLGRFAHHAHPHPYIARFLEARCSFVSYGRRTKK